MNVKVREVPVTEVVPGMILEEWPPTYESRKARMNGKKPVVVAVVGNNVYISTPDGMEYDTIMAIGPVKVSNQPSVVRGMDVNPRAIVNYVKSIAGADPEVFATHADGRIIPAWEYLPPKLNKHAKPNYVYFDGFQAEFTTSPTHCHGYFTDYTRHGLREVWQAARRLDPDAVLSIASALPIPREELMKYDTDQVGLGCAPSMNVYGEPRMSVPDPYELEWRFAGCHQHYGSMDLLPHTVEPAVRMLDAVVGVANVSLAGSYLVRERRRWYGRAGEYRYHPVPATPDPLTGLVKPNRLEYRVPDTVVMCHPAIYNLFVDLSRQVVKMGVIGLGFLWNADEDEVRTAVNEGDVTLARKILQRNQTILTRILQRAYGAFSMGLDNRVKYGVRTLLEGVESIVTKPTDVVGNWMLDREATSSTNGMPDEFWRNEGYRDPTTWHTGKWWGSAAGFAAEGRMV